MSDISNFTPEHSSPATSPDISPRTPAFHTPSSPPLLSPPISPSLSHYIIYARSGRRPPIGARGETFWAPSHHTYSEGFASLDEDDYRAFGVKEVTERRRYIASHIATTILKLDDEDDIVEAATRAKYGCDNHHICFHPAYPHIQAFVDTHHDRDHPYTSSSKAYKPRLHLEQAIDMGGPGTGESTRLIPFMNAPHVKIVRFAVDDGLAQIRLFEVEEEEEETLEEYFMGWLEEDKKVLLRLDLELPAVNSSGATTNQEASSPIDHSAHIDPASASEVMNTISATEDSSTVQTGQSDLSSVLQSERLQQQDCIVPTSG